jgi:hypothetical protein
MYKINNNFNNIFNNFRKGSGKKYLFCKNELYKSNSIKCNSCCKDTCRYNHNLNSNIKSPYYLFFDYLINSNKLEDAILEIIGFIKEELKDGLQIDLSICNWCKKRNNNLKFLQESISNLTISEFIIIGYKYGIKFKDWHISLAKESIRRNKMCKRNNKYICKKFLNMKIEDDDICCGGINCKYGLHINSIENYNGIVNESINFNYENNPSLIQISKLKKNLLDKPNLNIKLLLNSFIFNINSNIHSRSYNLNSRKKKRIKLDLDDFQVNENFDSFKLLNEVSKSIDKKIKRCYTPSKYDSVRIVGNFNSIIRPTSVSPELSLIVNSNSISSISQIDNLTFDSINSIDFGINNLIESNNKYLTTKC